MRSERPSPSLSNGAGIQTSPLYQSAGSVEKTACERPLANVGTAGPGAGAGAGAATAADGIASGLRGGSADAGLAATKADIADAVTAPARRRDLIAAPSRSSPQRSTPYPGDGRAEPRLAAAAGPAQRLGLAREGDARSAVLPPCPGRAARPALRRVCRGDLDVAGLRPAVGELEDRQRQGRTCDG